MTDILDETKASVREERLQHFLKLSLFVVTIVGALVMLISISINVYVHYKNNTIYKEGTKFFRLITRFNDGTSLEDVRDVIDELTLLYKDNKSVYSALAGFYLGDLEASKNNIAKAALYYEQVSDNQVYFKSVRDYAKLSYVNYMVSRNIRDPWKALALIHETYPVSQKRRTDHFYMPSKLLAASLFIESNQFEEAVNELTYLTTQKQDIFFEGNFTLLNMLLDYAETLKASGGISPMAN